MTAAVRYIVRDVDDAVVFYVEALGFQLEQQYGPNMAILGRDGATVWLAGPGASASKPMPDGAPAGARRLGSPRPGRRRARTTRREPPSPRRYLPERDPERPRRPPDPRRGPVRQLHRAVRARV